MVIACSVRASEWMLVNVATERKNIRDLRSQKSQEM